MTESVDISGMTATTANTHVTTNDIRNVRGTSDTVKAEILRLAETVISANTAGYQLWHEGGTVFSLVRMTGRTEGVRAIYIAEMPLRRMCAWLRWGGRS